MGDQGQLIPPTQQIPVNIEEEMRKSYLDYAMSVIIGRALPEVRDGLKPVHRRILYAMYKEGHTSDKRYVKCAAVVGEVIKKYHPHGDTALYDTLVRMAQDFNMRYPLIDGQGNFGSVDGDPAAAYRYTECRLTRLAEELLADIEKDTVDFVPNFDESTEEPTVLPTKVPNLLINGSDGIAVGMATKIPPHNLTEIIDATILLINKPGATIDEVLALVPGPDFPTGAYIYGKSGIRSAYATGRGQFTMRAKAAIERPTKEKQQIVITEIPYQVNKAKTIERIAQLVQEKKLEGISDMRDESDRDGMRIVIELKRGEQPEVLLNNLYKHTQLQENFGMIMLAIVNGQPRTLPLTEAIQLFIDHRVTVVRRRTAYELRKAQERAHILEGFMKALSQLDAIIKLIRGSKEPKEARAGLMTRFDFTERQAQAILELQLQRLTALERDKIQQEYDDLQKKIAGYKEILASEKVLKKVIVDELKQVQKEYGDARKTEIIEEQAEIKLEDLIADEDAVITVSHSWYLKRTPLTAYRQQGRGGKGRLGMKIEEGDELIAAKLTTGRDTIFLATHEGMAIRFPESDVRDMGRAAYGVNAMDLEEGDYIVGMEIVGGEELILSVTEKGFGKRTPIAEYRVQSRAGKGVINVKTAERNGKVVGVLSVTEDSEVMLISQQGKIARLDAGKIRESGRSAQGVKLLSLEEGDQVAAACLVSETGGNGGPAVTVQ